MNQIAKGRRGSISKVGDIATKTAHSYHTKGAIIKEALLLEKLNEQGISRVPQIIEQIEGGFSYFWIPGIHFDKAYTTATQSVKNHLAQQLLSHARTLDKIGVIHGELHRPTGNVLVNEDLEVSIIDFERGAIQDFSGKNMKAVGQWMRREGYVDVKTLQNLSGKEIDEIYSILVSHIPVTQTPRSRYGFLSLGVLSIILVTIDLISKYFFYDKEVLISNRFIEPVLNLGSAWSLPIPHWVTRIGAGMILSRICYEYHKKTINLMGGSLIIAGALGNSIDRIFYSGVRDFIDITSIIPYPIFNVADCFLVCGSMLLIVYTLRE